MKKVIGLSVVLVIVQVAHAADIEAGKEMAATVCAACHGANGVSVSDNIPNLAAQRTGYLEAQLKAFKDGTRKQPGAPTAIMSAIATQLSAENIANVAAYFASQPGAAAGAKSALLPNVANTRVTFPEGYKDSFTKYHTINFPVTKQVRYYYANSAAVAAAKAGKPLPDGSVLFAEVYAAKLDADNEPITGGDGFYVADKLLLYTAMAREEGWGKDIPEKLRNENWNYAIFTTDKQHRPGVNQAECLACHKPLDSVSYTFTLKQLAEAK
ncbi:MAG: cytochrome P460 family protein [Pseudolabrys sp.]